MAFGLSLVDHLFPYSTWTKNSFSILIYKMWKRLFTFNKSSCLILPWNSQIFTIYLYREIYEGGPTGQITSRSPNLEEETRRYHSKQAVNQPGKVWERCVPWSDSRMFLFPGKEGWSIFCYINVCIIISTRCWGFPGKHFFSLTCVPQ